MKRWSIYLGIILALQLAVAAGSTLVKKDYGAFKPKEALFTTDVESVDHIVIQNNDNKQSITLEKKEGRWIIAAMDNFPADQDKVKTFLEKLGALKKGWPVATTKEAPERFKVAPDAYERKITFLKNGDVKDALFIGTSPSFRKVHARRNSDDAVYAVNFNTHEAGITSEDWIDQRVLKHEETDIERIELMDCVLSRRDGKLTAEGIDESKKETAAEEANRLLKKIADLRIRDVLGTEAKPQYNQKKPVFSYSLALSSGASETYQFSKPKDEKYYVLKTSHRKEYFKVDEWFVDDIMKMDCSKLVREKKNSKQEKKEKEG
ncbi:MAG: DUF4340 domain-containing protein [Deltaproteobacteria bacterium]|nr:DUF4340 domain-containing protein [Deltaproteobacteria bacterium]